LKTRHNYARGKIDGFYMDEADEVLSWDEIDLRLDPVSPSLKKLTRELQAASIKVSEAIKSRK